MTATRHDTTKKRNANNLFEQLRNENEGEVKGAGGKMVQTGT